MQSTRELLLKIERIGKDNILTQSIKSQQTIQKNIEWDILRLDLIHPICSGNKFFKLKYYLEDAILKKHKIVKTFGGPWSNHIVATAFLANYCGLKSIGVIRGEEPKVWSATLLQAKEYGMDFEFVSREEFSKNPNVDSLIYTIPQGGAGILGVKGASEIALCTNFNSYTHIICACGTGTMFAGLIHASLPSQNCIGIAALNHPGLILEVDQMLSKFQEKKNYSIMNDFHWGGYAKKNSDLLNYMNHFYTDFEIPTDFIYTSKMVYAIQAMINAGIFDEGSKILSIHSGGLQGNKSLKKGVLNF